MANKVGVVIEVNAETDFVAKNDSFQTFVKEVADVVMAQNPADVEALDGCKLGEQTVNRALQEKILSSARTLDPSLRALRGRLFRLCARRRYARRAGPVRHRRCDGCES
ncbi:MAG: hypothetical protein ACLSVU_09945 [Christensenellales bacterium]